MVQPELCPDCGSNRAHGICPRCLIGLGLDGSGASLSQTSRSGVLDSLSTTIGPMPRVMLRDTEEFRGSDPIVRPGSSEMPGLADRSGRLQLFGEIARGGMGVVMKGRDNDLGRDLAVKVLLERHGDDPGLLKRFVEEAQISGQLQHPGVVPIYELGTFADSRPYFAMKLVKGRTLAEVMGDRDEPSSDLPRLLSIFLDVAQTVSYAHARGVIHRDLKPSNVMVGSFGEVQVMDWGLAKVLPRGGTIDDGAAGKVKGHSTVIRTARSGSDTDGSEHGSVMGTPSYMAPEQARGENDDLDERADVFALGSMLCEILTGQPAFTGRTSGEIQRKAALGDLADATARLGASGADPELVALARDCLARERVDRPDDAEAVTRRVIAYLGGVQDRLRAAERDRAVAEARAIEERRRRFLQVGLAASVLALTIVGVLATAILIRQGQARALAVERVLSEADSLLEQARRRPEDPFRWQTALAAVKRVEDNPGTTPGVRTRLDSIRNAAEAGLRDATLRQALLEARAEEKQAGPIATEEAYVGAFRAADFNLDELSLPDATALLKARPQAVVEELAAHLDHLAFLRRSVGRPAPAWRKPLQLAQAADLDTVRERIRSLLLYLGGEDFKACAPSLRKQIENVRPGDLNTRTAMLLAEALANSGDPGAGLDLLRRAVVRHPDDFRMNFTLAEILDGLGPDRRPEAVKYYYAARSFHPETSLNLAVLVDELGRADDAEAILRDLADRRPRNQWNLICLATFLEKHGQPTAAVAVLERAKQLGPLLPERLIKNAYAAYLFQPVTYASRGVAPVPTQAMRSAVPADVAAKSSGYFYPTLEAIELQKGDLNGAVTLLREAIRLKPDNGDAHVALGNLLQAQGKIDEAGAEYREAIRLKPDNLDAHLKVGIALQAQGKFDAAITEYREAIRLKPDFAAAHANLASVLQAGGKRGDAVAEYREALRLYPPGSPGAQEMQKRIQLIGD